jgi:UDP-N-acetylglucosamine--N-acetylmuramyl-(pentapeptide) pyrophosphoryl-undecaprenol N-acetylglucosamine transferase
MVGNPIRRAFVRAARRASADPAGFEARSTKILVLGGSQGARVLNQVAPRAIAEAAPGIAVIHQTGSGMVDEVRAAYAELGVDAEVTAFIDDMATAYASAQVVVARAGATTVAEVCAIGRPSILVPFPHAADDHQTKNARALEVAGAAVCIPEAALDTASLAAELRALTGDVTRRRAMAEAARAVGRPDAAAATVDDLCAWLGCPAARGAQPASAPPEALDHDLHASDRAPSEGEPSEGEPGDSPERETSEGDPRRAQGAAVGLRGQRPYVPSARRAARRSVLPAHRRVITVSAWD